MTISIWIIFVLIAGIGFRFYYKKNRNKLKKIPVNSIKKETKYALSDIDKMLNHITQENQEIEDKSKEKNLQEANNPIGEKVNVKVKTEENSTFDIKSGIISSVILKKKEDL